MLIFTKLASPIEFIKVHFVECHDPTSIMRIADICNRKSNCITIKKLGFSKHEAKSVVDVLYTLDSMCKLSVAPKLIKSTEVNFGSIESYVGYHKIGKIDDESIFKFWWNEDWMCL